jgi:hypothetical protein
MVVGEMVIHGEISSRQSKHRQSIIRRRYVKVSLTLLFILGVSPICVSIYRWQ